ncbi:MAG: hypothetical protein BGO05_09955 [Rhizobiales bacterium 63-7]|nr:FAD-binding oxidoreductase [Hyphomicrobiales bacterium]OJU67281.1 MAG: hypothetical protein BGO05_09955 [Rhizobiales bacterium 63-7]
MRNTPGVEKCLSELAALLGHAGYRDGEGDLIRHSRDASTAQACLPIAVLRPKTAEDVSAIMRICRQADLPVVPQGGLTGLSGGAVPVPDSVALSLERMNGVIEVDTINSSLTAWAGTPLETIQAAARSAGFDYPVDIGSRGTATIGGTVATNAGGIRVIRHGMTRQHLLGMEVVLADGTIITNLRSMLKDNAGFDLKHLFVGSEGCLGIITRVVLRLSPMPNDRHTALLALPDYDAALACLASARRTFQGDLTAFEAMWPAYWKLACKMVVTSRPLFSDEHQIYVLLEITGYERGHFETWLEDCFATGLVTDGVLAKSGGDAIAMWSIREAVGDVDREIGAHLNFDIGLAPSELADFARECDRELGEFVTQDILHLGHVADGNLHVIVPVPADDERRKLEIERRLFDLLAARGGSVSAEHGVGSLKRPWIGKTRSPEELELMRLLKRTLDPTDIFNPGKVIP